MEDMKKDIEKAVGKDVEKGRSAKKKQKSCMRGLLAAGLLSVILAGCGQESGSGEVKETLAQESASETSEEDPSTVQTLMTAEELFTQRDLSGEYEEAECEVITLGAEDTVISEEGTYLLQGSMENHTVIVDAGESAKVQLVLDGVTIRNETGAAICVKSADKVFLTLAAGTENVLENGGSYAETDEDNVDAVIFATCDLTVNGSGSLQIDAAAGHGIVSKDDLRVTGGQLTVSAERHGLSGKDSIRIQNAELTIEAGKDGMHSENEKKEEKGFVYIGGGSLKVTAAGDGISAGSALQIDGGDFVLTTGGGSANKEVSRDEDGDTVSTKGIKAGGQLTVRDGSFRIDAQDDALHANGSLTVEGGTFEISTGDDALHADETTTVSGGTFDIIVCYEGIEGNDVVISGGNISLYATDDGINAAGGNDGSGFGGMFGGSFGGSDSSILISGGEIYINAAGDGIDSNGDLTVTGGAVYVSGPETDGDGALDYESTGQITGGTVVAVGRSGMAMNFGDTSTQGSILISTADCAAGTEVKLLDAEGNVLLAYTSESRFNSVVVSCPALRQGNSYTVTAGEEAYEVTLEELIYGTGFSMGGFGGGMGGGRPGGMGGGRKPDGESSGLPDGMDGMEGMENFDGNPPELPEGMEGFDGNPPELPDGMEGFDGNPPELPDGMEGFDGNPPELPEGMEGFDGAAGRSGGESGENGSL